MLFEIKHLPSPITILIFLTLGCSTEKNSDDCIDEDANAPEGPCIKFMPQYVAVMTPPTETVVKLLMPEYFVGLRALVKTKN